MIFFAHNAAFPAQSASLSGEAAPWLRSRHRAGGAKGERAMGERSDLEFPSGEGSIVPATNARAVRSAGG